MPYNIRTRDGIELRNIPDDWKQDDPRLKEAVNARRSEIKMREREGRIEKMKRSNPGDYDPSSPEYQAKFGATSSMSGLQKVGANLGAGLTNFGMGLAQMALPKSAEEAVGITDESIDEKRARDDDLAQNTRGGKLLQIAGEAAPAFLIPGGSVARGIGKLGRVGQAAKAAGIGTRALPTLMAEGAVLGAAQGAITPTKSDESVLANTAMGAAGGAIIPAGLFGLGKVARPLIAPLRQRGVADELANAVDVSPAAQSTLARNIASSNKRVVDAPQSLAAITQNPEIARMELAARANADTAAPWQQMDELAANARWKALDESLGNQAAVESAKEATDTYARTAIPEVMKAMRPKALANGVADLAQGTKDKLQSAEANRNTAGREVFGYLSDEIAKSNKSAQALWNIRKTLRSWMEGTPPPGKAETRGAKMDTSIREAVDAIDDVLNRASDKRWSKFLDTFGEHARREASQKAGQNIRNAFLDEITASTRGPTTASGSPSVTRAKLEQALNTHGKNRFGETLDYQQRNVIDQVLSDLRADEILARAKSAMTGKGGSQTAPLLSLLKQKGADVNGHWFQGIANAVSGYGKKKQQQLLNQILLNPEDALVVMRQAERMRRPLSNAEKRLVYAARTVLASPSQMVLANRQVDPATEEVSE